jgi:hypothetical protein
MHGGKTGPLFPKIAPDPSRRVRCRSAKTMFAGLVRSTFGLPDRRLGAPHPIFAIS